MSEPDFDIEQAKMSNVRVYGGKWKFEKQQLCCPCRQVVQFVKGQKNWLMRWLIKVYDGGRERWRIKGR